MLIKRLTLLISLVTTLCIMAVSANDDMPVLDQYQFAPSQTVLKDLETKRQEALDTDKKLLVVFGADWCHDSRGLAQKFSTPVINDILRSKFAILFIDVGYLSSGFEAIKHVGQAIYYGTPTVLIVDPETNTVLNQSSIMHWTNADSIDLAEYESYFSHDFQRPSEDGMGNPVLLAYEMEIKQFEEEQAKRLRSAYAKVGPMLKQYKESDEQKPSAEFEQTWVEVKVFRTSILKDVEALLEQAKNKAQAGDDGALDYPDYPAFSWEG